MNMRNVPSRETVPLQNIISRGVPREYAEVNISDLKHDIEKYNTLKKYVSNIHDVYEQRVCLCLYGKNGSGKAQPLDELVLTPDGFKEMGSLSVGDYVIDEDGNPTKILNIFPQGKRPIYELTFDTGVTVRCDIEHLWKFKTRSRLVRNLDWRVDTLNNMMKNNLKSVNGGNNICVPISKAVEFRAGGKLPIEPYLLGVLIAEGYLSGTALTISTPDLDIAEKCRELLPPNHSIKKNTSYNYGWSILAKGKDSLKNRIISLGLNVKSPNRFIPKDYLLASKENRLELLKGLMDTDGNISLGGSFSYTTTSTQLKEDIIFLASSLGFKCTFSLDPRTEKYTNGVCYTITVQTDECIFSSNKQMTKYNKLQHTIFKKNTRTMSFIKSIEYKGEELCQCIMVDNPNHTYITKGFIVTHNTYFSSVIVKEAYRHRYTSYMITLNNYIDLEFRHRNKEEEEIRSKVLDAQFLVIDEIGKEHKTKTGSELVVLEKLLRHAHNKGNVVVLCTNLNLYSEDGIMGLYERYGKSVESLVEGDSLKILYDEKDLRKDVFKRKPLLATLIGG